jgi:acyl-CoA synthetase (AMP-forming)/AMP-acid ligase II
MSVADDRDTLHRRWYSDGYYTERTFGAEFIRGVEVSPSATMHFASATRPASITLAELHERGVRVATALGELGLRRGDFIACQVPNWVEGAILYHAALTLGLVVVPIVHIYGPAEVGYILDRTGARVLVIPDAWRNVDYVTRVAAMEQRASLDHVIVIGDSSPDWGIGFGELENRGPLAPVRDVEPDDVCMVMFTSGTTARPKGVQHTHNTLLSEVRSWGLPDPSVAKDVHLSPYPAGHMGGVLGLARAFLSGGTSIMIDAWDPERAVDLVLAHGVTAFASTPYFLRTLMDAAEARGESLPTLKEVNMGGAGVPPDLVRDADRLGWGAFRTYGSTEHPTTTTARAGDPVELRATTDGRTAPGTEVRIIDDDGSDVALGCPGEVASRGPELFVGYFDEADDIGAFLPGGWFRTGDIGVLDQAGRLTIVDRKKDIIIRGGENISSQEVESILGEIPSIAEVAVVAMEDKEMGERVGAFVVTREGDTITLKTIREHFLAAGVARQKIPEHLMIVDSLPRTALGKVKKAELRSRLIPQG